MNTAVVTLEHPVTTRKKSMRGIGITGTLIGLYAIGFGSYYINALGNHIENNFYSYAWAMVGSGFWFVVAGSFAIAVSASATKCHIVSGIVVAILASLAAFSLLIREAAIVIQWYSICPNADELCRSFAGAIFAHTLMLVLTFIEFVLVIVQASYSCRCCGRNCTSSLTVHNPTATTVTTTAYGNRYAPFQNEQENTCPAANQPPQNPAAPPSYY